MAISLDTLLALAAKGRHLFPLVKGRKVPIPESKGLLEATTDLPTIRKWFSDYPGCNWGLSCGPSGLLVVDIDTKKHDGHKAWADLCAAQGKSETACVVTPSAGIHLYFDGRGKTTASRLAKGIDTRGDGGYVLLPGCHLDGTGQGDVAGDYVAKGGRIQPLPEWVSQIIGQRKEAPTPEVPAQVVELDSPSAVADATRYLLDVSGATEGDGGDLHTLKVALRTKDYGVSEGTALDLMHRFWNHKCSPAWEFEDLERKVANAYRYGTLPAGTASPEAAGFTPIELPKPARLAMVASDIDCSAIPPRAWIIGNRLIEKFITVTVAPGGVGKSTHAILEGLSVATALPLTGDDVKRPGAVWFYNTEDPMDELHRRVYAAALHHGLDIGQLTNVHISSGRSRPLVVASSDRQNGIQVNQKGIDEVVEYIQSNKIKVWCVDPFVHSHYCDENSNVEIAVVMQQFGKIAEATGCAVHLVHHSRKIGKNGGEGDMEVARGASALGGAARIMHTLSGMAEEEAKKYNIAENQRRWYVRLDDAKSNMSPPAELVKWFKRVDVQLFNGDHVGTIEPVVLKETKVVKEDLAPTREAVLAVGHLYPENRKAQLEEVVMTMKHFDEHGAFKGATVKQITRQIIEVFAGAPVYIEGQNLRLHCEQVGKQWMLWTSQAHDWLG